MVQILTAADAYRLGYRPVRFIQDLNPGTVQRRKIWVLHRDRKLLTIIQIGDSVTNALRSLL